MLWFLRSKQCVFLIPVGLLIINFVLKILFLDSRSIAGDEPFSIYHAQMDVKSIVAQLSIGNNPPLFEIMLHYWIKLFGISPFAVRFLPLLFSVFTVYFVYKIGSDFFSQNIGLMAGLLFTFSNYSIYYSHETRVYSFFGLMATISMFAFFNVLKYNRRYWYSVLLVISNIILIYSHFLGFFIPVIQLLSCLIFKEIRKYLKQVIVLMVVMMFLYIPYITVFLNRLTEYTIHGTWVPPAQMGNFYFILIQFLNTPFTTIFISCLMIVIVFVIIKKQFLNITVYYKIAAFWFLFPFLLMFISSLEYLPYRFVVFYDRYLVFTSIGFYISMAAILNYLSAFNRIYKILFWLPLILLVLTCKPDIDNHRNVADTVKKVKELKTEKTIVYLSPFWFDVNFVYYYNRRWFQEFNTTDIKKNMYRYLNEEKIFPIFSNSQIDTSMLSGAERVIFLDAAADFTFPENNIHKTISSFFPVFVTYEYPEIFKVFVYKRSKK